METYLLTYRVCKSPAHIVGTGYPRQGHKFESENDDKARQIVIEFCAKGHFKALRLHKEVQLRV